ncbi:hypothetical protein QA597_09385 [Marinilabiliaceae bacterium ANBcel2]|nr:hypothetical protein [Marinilabiliaceae bacterium ANBcel2]
MQYFKIPLFVVFSLLILSSCSEDDIHITTDNSEDNRTLEFSAPLARVLYTGYDMVDDADNEHFKIREDGLLCFEYTEEVFIEWDDLVVLNDFSEQWEFYPILSSPLKSDNGSTSFSFTEKVILNNREDVRYDSLYVKEGEIEFDIELPDNSDASITVVIPEVLDGGKPLTYQFDASGANNRFYQYEDIAGMFVELSQDVEESQSYFSVEVDIDYYGELSLIDAVKIDFSLFNLKHEMIYGFMGYQTAEKLDATIDFDLFDEIDVDLTNRISFFDLSIGYDAINRIGVPFNVKVDNIRFLREREEVDPGEWNLLIDGENFLFVDVEGANTDGHEIFPGSAQKFLDRNNSNVVDVFNEYPDKLVCDIISQSNEGYDSDHLNFMGQESDLQTDMTIYVPAWISADMYSRKDTVEFDFRDITDDDDDVDEIQNFDLYFDFENKLPFDVNLTVWVLDEYDNIIDYIIEDEKYVIKSGTPDSDGFINEAEETSFQISLSNEQIVKYREQDAKNMVLQTEISTYDPENSYVRIFDSSQLFSIISFTMNARIPGL